MIDIYSHCINGMYPCLHVIMYDDAGRGIKLSVCGKCGYPAYCSRECQIKDWTTEHFRECKRKSLGVHDRSITSVVSVPATQLLLTRWEDPLGLLFITAAAIAAAGNGGGRGDMGWLEDSGNFMWWSWKFFNSIIISSYPHSLHSSFPFSTKQWLLLLFLLLSSSSRRCTEIQKDTFFRVPSTPKNDLYPALERICTINKDKKLTAIPNGWQVSW